MFAEQMRKMSQSVIFQRHTHVFSMLVCMSSYVPLFVIILYGCFFALGALYIGYHPEQNLLLEAMLQHLPWVACYDCYRPSRAVTS